MTHRYSVLVPEEPLENAVSLLLDSQEKSFIVKEKDDVIGILSQKEIIAGLAKFGKNIPVEKVMNTKFSQLQTEELLGDVMERFNNGQHTLMPVFKEKELKGVLDLENISEYIQIQVAAKK